MSGQLLRKFAFPSGRTMSVVLAKDVQGQGFTRILGPIEQRVKDEVAEKAEAALRDVRIVPAHIQAQVAKVVLTSLEHKSDMDPTEHATGVLEDENGRELGKVHIASDSKNQQPMRHSNR
ncbi:hypothetical protein VTL71DRAFT_14751 [Oculimacula yallundae]|uniref:Uncharacterized protein n=1 Tax=Oculimacula yallundae TaxID=86028 RepID=A0ABR4CKQ6_9HELO